MGLYTLLKDIRYPSIGETALTALIGFSVVFLGIALLVFIVWLIGKIMQSVSAPKTKKVKSAQKTVTEKPSDTDGIDDETIAVIMASLMAYYAQENGKCEFTVRRIKRI